MTNPNADFPIGDGGIYSAFTENEISKSIECDPLINANGISVRMACNWLNGFNPRFGNAYRTNGRLWVKRNHVTDYGAVASSFNEAMKCMRIRTRTPNPNPCNGHFEVGPNEYCLNGNNFLNYAGNRRKGVNDDLLMIEIKDNVFRKCVRIGLIGSIEYAHITFSSVI